MPGSLFSFVSPFQLSKRAGVRQNRPEPPSQFVFRVVGFAERDRTYKLFPIAMAAIRKIMFRQTRVSGSPRPGAPIQNEAPKNEVEANDDERLCRDTHHPANAEAVGEHAEARRPERLGQR